MLTTTGADGSGRSADLKNIGNNVPRANEFHFVRFMHSYPPNAKTSLPRPLTPLKLPGHRPSLPNLERSSPAPPLALARRRQALARPCLKHSTSNISTLSMSKRARIYYQGPRIHNRQFPEIVTGNSQTWFLQTWLFAFFFSFAFFFLRRRPSAIFCAVLPVCVCVFCVHLRSFALERSRLGTTKVTNTGAKFCLISDFQHCIGNFSSLKDLQTTPCFPSQLSALAQKLSAKGKRKRGRYSQEPTSQDKEQQLRTFCCGRGLLLQSRWLRGKIYSRLESVEVIVNNGQETKAT